MTDTKPADNWDYAYGGCLVGLLFSAILVMVLVYGFIGVIEPRRYCAEGFGRTELVLHEEGTWTCEPD